MIQEEYCPRNEIKMLEEKLWVHKMVGSEIEQYATRFHELSGHMHRDCPQLKKVGGNTTKGRAFVISQLLNIKPTPLDYKHTVELADGKLIETEHIFRVCVMVLANHELEIDLMSITLGCFDVVVGMDWLFANQADIVCNVKIVRVTLPSRDQISIQGERRGIPLNIMSCMKANKCLQKGCPETLALITEQSKKERKIEDIDVVRDYSEVFPEDLPGLPPK
ncbi:hypothetical protein R6Q59_033171 [Mikania micrantha]